MEKNITLELTQAEVSSVISGLAKFPFEQVSQLINKIAAQAQSQIKPEDEPKSPKNSKK